jgi:hypothetical protein
MVFGSLADILYQWDYLGVFDFLLPFLLVFAIVYGILSSTKFFGTNRGVYVIIAVVIGLLALRYQFFFSSFLSELFPRLGIGISILLALLILVGMFIAEDETRYWGWGLAAIGVIIAIVVVYQSFNVLGYGIVGGIGSDFVGFILLGVLLIGVIIAVAASGGDKKNRKDKGGKAVLLPWRE